MVKYEEGCEHPINSNTYYVVDSISGARDRTTNKSKFLPSWYLYTSKKSEQKQR
jgi:hypothetical protein